MWFRRKQITANDLKGLPNPERRDKAPQTTDPRLEKLLSWRTQYARLYAVPFDQVITENQLRWTLVYLDKNCTVEEALEQAGLHSARVGLLLDDIEEALESADGTPEIIALREEYEEFTEDN